MKDLESLEPQVPEEEIAEAAEQPAEETPKAPEAPEAEKPEEKEEKKQTLVPHQALHEERKRRQEIEAQLRNERAERQRNEQIIAQRLQELYQASQQQNQPQVPSETEDPLAASLHGVKVTQEQLKQLQTRMAQEDWQRQQVAQQQQLIGWAQSQAAEFQRETPDFPEAYQHMRTIRMGELEEMGLTPQQIQHTLVQDELWVFQHAAQTGRNPAEIVYGMAKRTGWQKKQAGEQKIETLQKGLQASKSLGNGGGSAGMPTPEQIANMSEEEFGALKAKLAKSGKRISDVI